MRTSSGDVRLEKQEKWMIMISIVFVVINIGYIIFHNLPPTIVLKKGDIKIALGEIYQEPGYSATKGFFQLTKKVVVQNQIDNSKIGTYDIIYKLKNRKKEYTKIRHVTVEDRIPPTIELKGEKTISLCPGKEYQEDGYVGLDNYDGDLTKQIKITKESDKVIYSLKDQSGNVATESRTLKYEDLEAPILTLKGGNAYSLYLGSKYQEPGYEASDSCDGDLTDKVIITGHVDTNKIGSYTLTYEVKDQSGKSTSASRKVIVVGPKPANGKVIYLTFDDGPSANITPALLDILKEEKVPATFFVLNRDTSLDYLIKREHNEGHTVALHGASHNYHSIYTSSEAFWSDMNVISNKVEALTGTRSMIIRFPGGSSNTVSRFNPGIMTRLTSEATNKGYHYFDWNVGSGDAGEARTETEVYNNVIKSLGNKNNVVLMHDYSGNYKTLNAIRNIIRYGKNNGYTFAKITMDTPVVHHRVAN